MWKANLIRAQAPNIELKVEHITHLFNEEPFESGLIELVVGGIIDSSPHVVIEKFERHALGWGMSLRT